jgi:alkaline phosphatase
MSHPTIAAARVYMGGEEKKLHFEHFPFTASSKTYCVDKQVSDSACTATAYLTGVKANDATIGLSARALRSNCVDGNDNSKKTESIASWAMKAGKDAGFVTTTRVTHASPTGVYGHITDRDWEGDAQVRESGCNPDTVDDIAEQLINGEVGKKLKVMMGGGSKNFIDRRYTEHGTPGNRTDGKHLINDWQAADPARTYVNNRQGLMNLEAAKVKQVLGLFNPDHISYNLDIQRDATQASMPSLTDMTVKAIEILSQNENGYFLFVEGGRIDHGHHKNEAKYAIDETAEFSKAIEAAMKIVNINETLVVVTADHGHVMTLAGYAVSLSACYKVLPS